VPRHDTHHPFYRLSGWLRERFGQRVYKISLRGGFDCPNRDGRVGRGGCAFCAGEALEPTGYRDGLDIAAQLEVGRDYVRRRHGARSFIAYFQDYSATYAPLSCLQQIYTPALAADDVVGLAVGTRPDCLADEALDWLASEVASRKELWLELGLQIADDGLLRALGRGHDVASFCQAVEACHRRGLRVCAHVIVGLPGASVEQERATVALLAELGVWGVKLHAFHVLRGTRFAAQHAERPLPLLSRETYIERVIDLLERLPKTMVVHRVTGEAPRRLTLAPEWTINKLAVFDAVLEACERRGSFQGRSFEG
jgi:radical SAM protein (TIGR01212 family)